MVKTIVLVSNTSWSFVKFRLKLLLELGKAGYKVYVLAPQDEESKIFVEQGLTYVPLKKLHQKSKNPIHDYRFFVEIKQLYKKIKPDLVIHYTIKPNIYGTIAATGLGLPCISVVTGLGYTYIKGGILARITDVLYRKAFKKVNQVWFLNRDDRAVFTEERNIVPISKTELINGEGIDARVAFDPKGYAQFAHQHGGVRFVFIGRLLHDKGIREYVAAAQIVKMRHPNVEFNILGYLNVGNPSAVDKATMDKWERSGVVNYMGAVSDVRPVLMQHDCVVLPSYREGMSTTLMEAAAMGLPLIASDIPGCRELVEAGRSGFLCKPKSTESLVTCMAAFVEMPADDRIVMGKRGREKMLQEFDMDTIIGYYLGAIPRILKVVTK